MSEVDYGKGRDLSVIWEFRKIIGMVRSCLLFLKPLNGLKP
jgi:hypothetical protein